MTLGGTIDIPKVGPVPKLAVFGILGAGAAYVGWRYWQNRSAGTADASATTDPGFADPGTLPGVAGAVPDDGSFGGTTGGTGGDSAGQILTNSAWSNDALAKLTATGSYDAGAVAAALGAYLGSTPLSSDQQSIVRAAIAVSGYPPVGSFSIIPGGDATLAVAPSGLSAQSIATTSASIAFTGVPGAASYVAYRNGVAAQSSSASPIVMTGLAAGTSYTVHVVAKTSAGKVSPDSPSITFKTAVAAVSTPTGLKVTATTSSTVTVTWKAVPGAKGYQVFANGAQNGNSVVYNEATARYLKAGTRYSIGVKAIGADNKTSGMATVPATTKK